MPNAVTPTGITIQSRAEIVAALEAGFRSIYGADINLAANTPDGNLIQLLAQAFIDYLEFDVSIFNSFDPDTAVGTVLDLRCAINGVARLAGTYSTQLVTVVTSQGVTLVGLDTAPTAPFTVSDSTGNRFFLAETTVIADAGSTDLEFRAEDLGAVLVAPSTLTTIVTVQLGVTSVTNGVLAGTTGVNEETDAQLRLRRQNSVEVPSKGYLEGLVGALYAIDGVTSVLVLENITNATDGDGIPGHSIWCVVNGGTDAEVANAIYVHRNAGCGMKGAVSVNVTQVDGSIFAVLFDRPTPETLWISLDATAITGSVDEDYIRAQILAQLSYNINQPAVASQITALVEGVMQASDSDIYLSNVGVGNDGVTYAEIIQNATKDSQWALASVRVIINGSPGV